MFAVATLQIQPEMCGFFCATEDYKPEAAVCVVFLAVSHRAVSALLLCISTFRLSPLHCIGIYHISYKVAQQKWKE